MATVYLAPPLKPKGRRLRVVLVVRISTENQDVLSLADQEAMLRKWLRDHYGDDVYIIVIAGQGSGQIVDREEALRLVELVETGEIDLVLAEDLGRIYRRLQALIFCETCEDHGTRVIVVNDCLDTARADWQMSGMFAAVRHEKYTQDTSARIRRTQQNRFDNGMILHDLIGGYIKPPGATHESQVQKDPVAESIYDEWFRRLEMGERYSEVGDWLQERGIPVGPGCRTNRWTGPMVARITHNVILKGLREWNRKKSKRANKSGRSSSIKAPPEELRQRFCPNLVMIEPARYDRVIALLASRNAKYRRNDIDGRDPRANVPKKRTHWPGQHLHCGNCGGLMVYGAHGQKDRLVCTNAREYRDCWMSFSVDGPKARKKLLAAISQEMETLPGFDAAFRQKVAEQLATANADRQGKVAEADRQIPALRRKIGNVTAAIADAGSSAALLQQLRTLEGELTEAEQIRADAVRERCMPALPSPDELLETWKATFEKVLRHDEAAVRLVKQLVPQIVVFPVRLRDGGTPGLRAKVSIDLTAAMPELADCVVTIPDLKRAIVIDLFDPPQREQHRIEIVRLHRHGTPTADISARVGITKTAVLNALRWQRQLEELGVSDPYEVLTEPPADYAKLRRHKHPRFVNGKKPDEDVPPSS